MAHVRRPGAALAAALAAWALLPGTAHAHGLAQRADLPIPEWLFGWAAAIVLVVSFAALAVLWPRPRLERAAWKPLPGGGFLASRPVEIVCGLIGIAMLGVVVWSGLAGPNGPQDNFAPTFVLIIVWVGFVFASVLLGDVFHAFNPWRAAGRATGWAVDRVAGGRRPGRAEYSAHLGRWPAAVLLLGFTWVELASGWGELPRNLTAAVLVYSAITWLGMARYGVEAWTRNGEAFGVYFGLFARLSVFETRDRVLGVRPLLSGLPQLDARPGTVAVVAVMIGTVTFDGLSQGVLWRDASLEINDFFAAMGFSLEQTPQLTATVGLLLGVALVAAFYALGIRGARSVGGDLGEERLRRGFVHSLIPIAMVYVAAHYLTYLVFQGQAIGYLASDPIGRGWDLFGTASSAIDYSVISQNGTWYAQVAFVVLGHVAALVLAHDRALVLYGQARLAVRSQYWMLGVMVGFTTLALWLLAQANA